MILNQNKRNEMMVKPLFEINIRGKPLPKFVNWVFLISLIAIHVVLFNDFSSGPAAAEKVENYTINEPISILRCGSDQVRIGDECVTIPSENKCKFGTDINGNCKYFNVTSITKCKLGTDKQGECIVLTECNPETQDYDHNGLCIPLKKYPKEDEVLQCKTEVINKPPRKEEVIKEGESDKETLGQSDFPTNATDLTGVDVDDLPYYEEVVTVTAKFEK